tara:strand:- start:12522 stop:13238 length:717 start_codon:yes stop_codon:yes gene_type:complete
MGAKDKVRKLFNLLHLDVTKNLKYDRLTQKIINTEVNTTSNCIDVGCHKGEILDMILENASEGKHFAFEPIPSFFNDLKLKYDGQATVLPYALSNEQGTTTFHYVKNAPAYSGINKRSYKVKTPEIDQIEVEKRTLDSTIPEDHKIHFMKIDVEGGEFDVLKGSSRILDKDHPLLIFEFGNGASEFYHAQPENFFDYLADFNYGIFTLERFIDKQKPLTRAEFKTVYKNGSDYYFVAK